MILSPVFFLSRHGSSNKPAVKPVGLLHSFSSPGLLLANALIGLSVKIWGFQSVLRVMDRVADLLTASRPEDVETFVEQTRLGIKKVKRNPVFAGKCLSRSMLLHFILRRRGVDSVIRIGVNLTRQEFKAHAWVERHGRPVNARDDIGSKYSAFPGGFR